MAWNVELSLQADRELSKLDPKHSQRILKFLSERVANLADLRSIGEALHGPCFGEFWKYRVGDYRFRFQGLRCQIARNAVRPGLRRAPVKVEKRLDGKLAVCFREHSLTVSRCETMAPQTEPKPRPRPEKSPAPPRQYNWMEGFDLQRNKPLGAVRNDERGPLDDSVFPR